MSPTELHAIVTRIGIDIRRDSNNNFMACCPFHEESSPSWGIAQSEPHYHGCFACHAKGTLFDLLIRVGNIPEEEARRICKLGESDPAFDELEDPPEFNYVIPESKLYPYRFTKKLVRYMRKRQLTIATMKKLGLLYHHEHNRVLFPWYFGKDLVGVTGRTLDPKNEGTKTIPYFGSKKNKYLYLPNRKIKSGKFFVVEGEVDAAVVFESSFKNVGAIGHGRFSKGQKKLLLESPADEIVCFFDDDKTGQALFEETCEYFDGKKIVSRVDYTKMYNYKRFNQLKIKLDPAAVMPDYWQTRMHTLIVRNADWCEI